MSYTPNATKALTTEFGTTPSFGGYNIIVFVDKANLQLKMIDEAGAIFHAEVVNGRVTFVAGE